MSSQPQPRLSPEKYLEIERKAQVKSEYYAGEMFAMAGATYRHNLITFNIGGELRTRLRGRNCRVTGTDMRVCTGPEGLYSYPDIIVICDEPRFLDNQFDTLLNPVMIVEILSPSTKDYDRGSKFELYRMIESLRDYLLVAQDRPHVEHYARQPDSRWLLADANGLPAAVAVSSLGIELPLAEIYSLVNFTQANPE